MGRALVRAAHERASLAAAASTGASVARRGADSELRVVAGVASAKSAELGKDIGELAGIGATGVRVTSDLHAALAACDVAIDFSSASATAANVEACAAARKPIVIGTTGFAHVASAAAAAVSSGASSRASAAAPSGASAATTSGASGSASSDALRAIEKAAHATAVLVAPNTSLGVTLLIELVKAAAKALPGDFDIEISEAHHRLKRDAPSGTALALGRAAAQGRGQDFDKVAVKGRSGEAPRQQGEIGFAVTRAGDIVGDHTVLFAGAGEELLLGHRATDRAIFARGALEAAAWLAGRPPGRYAMRDVVGYKTEA